MQSKGVNMRRYKKLVRKHRRKLIKLAKETSPWDYGFGLDYFILFLEFMRDYYEIGVNVDDFWEGDGDRIKTIQKALDEYDKYLVKYDKFNSTLIKDGTVELAGKTFTGITTLKVEYDEEDYREYELKKEKHWKKFWSLVSKHIRSWWD